MLGRRAPLAPVLAVVLVVAVPARAAADATLTFDDLPAGTTVTTQYGGQGLAFGATPPGQAVQSTAHVPVVANVGTLAASGSQVGQVTRRCLSAECVGTSEVWWQYSGGPRSRVSLSVGAFGTASATLTMTAYTSSGTQIRSSSSLPTSATVTGGAGFKTRLTLTSLSTNIAFVRIRSSSLGSFGIDSVTFDTPPPPAPSFTVRPRGATSLNVAQGSSGGIDLVIDRVNYSGAVRLTADPATLPAGVTMAPVSATSSTQQIVRVTFTAGSTASLIAGRQVRIVGTPATSPPSSRSTTVTLNVVAFVDSRITGIEATQGTQTLALPWRDTLTPGVKTYAGVPLYANGRTVVRVYASNGRSYNPSGGVPGATVRLHGVNASTGATLPSSPLLPQAGPSELPFRSVDLPGEEDRGLPLRAFTFTLPASWTGDGVKTRVDQRGLRVRLRAELVLQPSQTLLEGTSSNNSQTLQDLAFTPTCCLDVATVLLRHDDFPGNPRAIGTVLREALTMLPLEATVPDYQTEMDVTDDIDDPPKDQNGNPVDNRSVVAGRMIEFSQRDAKNDVVVGFGIQGFPACGGAPPYVVCDDLMSRPYTSSAHEFFHALGAVVEDATFDDCARDDACHASMACTAGTSGTRWPPDEIGLLQGVGLDRSTAPPYRILASPPGVPATPGAADDRGIYDVMSYCAGESNSWLGPKNWTDVLNRYARNTAPAGAASAGAPPRAAAAAQAPQLVVNAAVGPSGTTGILSVYPGIGDRGVGSGPSPYTLVVRDAGGGVLARVPMRGRTDHFHDRPSSLVLTGVAAADVALAARVEVVRDGAVVATRVRSPHAPSARFLSPRRGQLVGRGDKLPIRWRAGDADGDRLQVVVEWSARGGRPGTWRTVSLGENGGRVALPSDYFAGSDDAFLRLRVNDGFNETLVLSPAFRTVHRGPTARILSPQPRERVRRGAVLFLRAAARDERGSDLGRSGLRWFDGRRKLGRGEQLGVSGLRVGRHRIRLVATDARGRRATRSVRVRVLAVTPLFEQLEVPSAIRRRARRLMLRVASTVPALLTVSGRDVTRTRAAVNRRRRTVRVAVRRGERPLRLRLRLTAGERSRSAVVLVARAAPTGG